MIVKQDPGELAADARCPDEPMMPATVYADHREGALWNSRVRDAGEKCRLAYRSLQTFARGR